MKDSIVIAFTNSKGGVGKTTTSLNLGAALSAAGKRVLLIDADPQGNLTAALGFTPAEHQNTLAKLILTAVDSPEDMEIHLPHALLHTESGVDLIPAKIGCPTRRRGYRSCGCHSTKPQRRRSGLARRFLTALWGN